MEKIYLTCGIFNFLNIKSFISFCQKKSFISLNVIFLFLCITCALKAQINMTLFLIKNKRDKLMN
jgi:uncharacterized membrane protein